LAKKWQEVEFLDYKERQIRRRSQKSRELEQRYHRASPGIRGVKIVAVLSILFVGFVVAYVFWQERIKTLSGVLFASRTTLVTTEIVGVVDVSLPTRMSTSLKAGDRFTEDLVLSLSERSRCTFSTCYPNSRIVFIDRGTAEISKIAMVPGSSEDIEVRINGKQGLCLIDARVGEPRIKIQVPQGAAVYSQRGLFQVGFDEKESFVLVREGRVVVAPMDNPDKAKRTPIGPDERLVIRKGPNWDKPILCSTPESIWR